MNSFIHSFGYSLNQSISHSIAVVIQSDLLASVVIAAPYKRIHTSYDSGYKYVPSVSYGGGGGGGNYTSSPIAAILVVMIVVTAIFLLYKCCCYLSRGTGETAIYIYYAQAEEQC